MWPMVSIVIPSFNQGRFIRRTIRSIQLQDYPGEVEIIVSDGGSTDETVDVLKSLDGIKWWSTKDRGFADAVNKGFKAATGEIWAIQSSDDFYLQGAIRKAVTALKEHPECVLASGSDVQIDNDNKVVCVHTHTPRIINFPKLIAYECFLHQHATFFRQEGFNKIGGVRESVDRCADFDLFYRMLHFGPGTIMPDLMAVYQLHPAQRTLSLADEWVTATLRTIEDAEKDPILGKLFRLNVEEKEYFEVFTVLNWQSYAGGNEGMKVAAKFARQVTSPDSKWTPRAKEHARNWLAAHRPKQARNSRGIISPRIYERIVGAQKKLKLTLRDIRRKLGLTSKRQRKIPDIHWWANEESASRNESRT